MIDEVQCGIGRSGTFFAYEVAGIQPDAIGMAKGLGGGFPIGAIWVAEPHAGLFGPGSHGTTFGGNPLASAAALATLEVIEAEDLLAKVTRRSRAFTEQLAKLAVKHPHLISEIRGRGYMIGIALKVEATPLVTALRKEGLLTVPAGKHVLRLLPPLNVKKSELKHCIAILDTCLSVYRSPEAQG
jgi:acetylornithine aminotransferase/acetylornithine/N-succinyldiaminopimelate aminotransferase